MSEGEKKLRAYLARSSGNGGHPTDYSIRCIRGMIETGELEADTVRNVGGQYLVNRINEQAKQDGLNALIQ
jgi:hypothetical protein